MARTHILTFVLLIFVAACSASSSGSTPPPAGKTQLFSLSPSVTHPQLELDVEYTFDLTGLTAGETTLSISGGEDSNRFTLDQDGTLSFRLPPEFAEPIDDDGNNIYEVVVRAEDSAAYGQWTMRITVEEDLRDDYAVERIVTGLTFPVHVSGIPLLGGEALFIVEKGGLIKIWTTENPAVTVTILDVSDEISTVSEQGLFILVPAPDFVESGEFYVTLTNLDGDTELRRYTVENLRPITVNEEDFEILLTVEQPEEEHNGGWIGFGPDGYLYWALGDGAIGDPGNHAQNTETLKGAILRLDVSDDDFPGDDTRNYAIPPTNPFVGEAGRDEIFAYGFRNPWRASFEEETGALWVGDVGQDQFEEINLVRSTDAGGNYGWKRREGTAPFEGGADDPSFILPVAQYAHDPSTPGTPGAVTGGFVYTGRASPLRGKYIFGDFVAGEIYAVEVDDVEQGTVIERSAFEDLTGDFAPDFGVINNVVSFGTDDAGDLYIVDPFDGEIYKVQPQ